MFFAPRKPDVSLVAKITVFIVFLCPCLAKFRSQTSDNMDR